MSDMRLVVAGAAGRMGRMLVQAIHADAGRDALRRARAAGLVMRWARTRAFSRASARLGVPDHRRSAGRARRRPTA